MAFKGQIEQVLPDELVSLTRLACVHNREAVHTTQSTDLMRANLQLREALRRAGQVGDKPIQIHSTVLLV